MALRTLAFLAIMLQTAAFGCLANEVTMKIDQALSREMDRSDKPLAVIITMENREDFASLTSKGIKPDLIYENFPAFSAVVTPEQIRDIIRMPQVKSIELDTKAHALTKP